MTPSSQSAARLLERPGIRWLAVGLGHAAVLLLVFHVVWWPGSARMFFGWDCLDVYWPDIVFQVDSLRSGELPLWNPFSLLGYAFHREPQTGFLSPVNWLLWIASVISDSRGAWLVQLKVLLSLWLGLVGMHALVVSRTRSHLAGAVAALCYVLGGPLLVHKNSALLWPLLYLPWLILALSRFVDRPCIRRGAVLALAAWLCGGAGSPPGFFYCLLVCVPYWAVLTAFPLLDAPEKLRAQAPGLGVACLLTLGLLLAVYLPAWEATLASARAARTLAYALQQPVALGDLWELLVPNLNSNWFTDIYMGAACPLLAVFGLAAGRAPGSARGERWFWLGATLFALLCALGSQTPLLPFLADHVPGFGLFRVAYRYKLPFAFGLALLAGDGLGAWVAGRGEAARRWMGPLALAWIAGAWAVAWAIGDGKPASAVAVTIVATLLLVAARGRARIAFALLVPAVLCDLWAGGHSKIAIMQPPPYLAASAAKLGGLDGLADHRFRFYASPSAHESVLLGARELGGYAAHPLLTRRFDELLRRVRRTPGLLARFNVRWALSGVQPPGSRRHHPGVSELPEATPLLRVYGGASVMNRADLWKRLEGPQPIARALVDARDAEGLETTLPDSSMSPVDGRLLRYARNTLVFEVAAPEAGVAVLNESFDPAWTSEVNGRPARVFRADHLLRAVAVPSGDSTIVFRYRPLGYLLQLCVFLLALLSALALIAVPKLGAS